MDNLIEKLKTLKNATEFRKQHNITVEPAFKTSVDLPQKDSKPNHLITHGQIQYAESFADLTEMSQWSADTLIKHIELLIKEGVKFDYKNITPSKELIKLVATAKEALLEKNDKDHFNDKGELKLKPIFEYLNECIEYNDIRLALLFQNYNVDI